MVDLEYLGTEKPVSAMRPLLSVRLLTYNHHRYIRQCIDSVLMQVTDFPFEIVIGEDDSTDGTRTICKDYADRYPDRIRLMLRSERNKIILNGVKTSRYNFIETMKDCRGKFVALMDGDDYWTDSRKLQQEVDFLSRHPSFVLAFHNASHANAKGGIVGRSVLSAKQKRDVSQYELQQAWGPPVTSTLCFRNVIHQFPEEFLEAMNGDVFLISLLGEYGSGKYLSSITPSVYRLHPRSMFSALPAIKGIDFARLTFFHMAKYYRRVGNLELSDYFETKEKRLAAIVRVPWRRFFFQLKRSLYLFQLHYTHDRIRRFFKK